MRAKSPAKEVNDVLGLLVKSINTSVDGKLIWNVVSALRGPDRNLIVDGGERDMTDVKDATTCVLRYALGLNYGIRNGRFVGSYWFSVHEDTKEFAEYRRERIPYDHFGLHARDAFRALGLSWDRVNTFKVKAKKKALPASRKLRGTAGRK